MPDYPRQYRVVQLTMLLELTSETINLPSIAADTARAWADRHDRPGGGDPEDGNFVATVYHDEGRVVDVIVTTAVHNIGVKP